MTTTDWNPQQYRKFADERAQPFHDLIALVQPGAIRRAVDLGCGPGELTALAAEQLGVEDMVGIDNSPSMLESAQAHRRDGVAFQDGDIAEWTSPGDIDLVLAAASLQWVPDHAGVLARWTAALAPGGQLAVQVPANASMLTHRLADELAHTEPYLSAFGGEPPVDPVAAYVLEPEQYAQLLYDLGYERQHVHLRVYPHLLGNTRDVVQWVKGTTLTRMQKRLPADLFERFLADYEAAYVERMGERSPFFFPFRRILMWGRLPQ